VVVFERFVPERSGPPADAESVNQVSDGLAASGSRAKPPTSSYFAPITSRVKFSPVVRSG